MLYDPKWEVKANPCTLDALITWLEKQPADQWYCYQLRGRCLAAQYNKHIGRRYRVPIASPRGNFSQQLEYIAVGEPHTFGAALERAHTLTSR